MVTDVVLYFDVDSEELFSHTNGFHGGFVLIMAS